LQAGEMHDKIELAARLAVTRRRCLIDVALRDILCHILRIVDMDFHFNSLL
jgi:hypothetical protein